MDTSQIGFLGVIATRTAIVLLALVVGLRLTGKRQAGEWNLRDVLTVLLIANAVQNAMTKGDGRLSVAFVASATLIALGLLLGHTLSRVPALESLTLGVPTLLVEEGRILEQNLRREGVSQDMLEGALRDQGIAELSEVRLAVLEIDGSISVVARDPKARA